MEILDAVVGVLLESGYDRLTFDAIAARAKTSKATLYRHWADKPSLVVDGLCRARTAVHLQDLDTGDLVEDLLAYYCGMAASTIGQTGAMLAAVVTALGSHEAFARLFRREVLQPMIETNRRIYERAQERGQIRDDADLDVLSFALPGFLLHRALLVEGTLDDTVVSRAIDTLVRPWMVGRPPAEPRRLR